MPTVSTVQSRRGPREMPMNSEFEMIWQRPRSATVSAGGAVRAGCCLAVLVALGCSPRAPLHAQARWMACTDAPAPVLPRPPEAWGSDRGEQWTRLVLAALPRWGELTDGGGALLKPSTQLMALWRRDSVLTTWGLAQIIVDDWVTGIRTASRAVGPYRTLSGEAGPILGALAHWQSTGRRSLALQAVRLPPTRRRPPTFAGWPAEAHGWK